MSCFASLIIIPEIVLSIINHNFKNYKKKKFYYDLGNIHGKV